MSHSLDGQVALVTGANRGIGQQISRDLAAAGARVVLGARNLDSLGTVVAQIEQDGGSCEPVSLDVTNIEQITEVIDGISTRHSRLDLLVNNAGIGAGADHSWDLPVNEWWSVLEVNVRGVYACTRAAMQHMTRQKFGRIIDVGSLVGTYPNPVTSPYSASKAALFRWNSCLAMDAKEFGISVFIISPGLVATDMTRDVPAFADVPPDQWTPIEKTGALVVDLASGRGDKLAGRFIHAEDDLTELIAHADEIIAQDLQTLSMRFYGDED